MSVKNTLCWADIPVIDLDRAIAFYSAIFDQPIEKMEHSGCSFGLLPHAEDNVAGCLSVIPGRKPSQNGTLVYLNVGSYIDVAIAAAQKHGGKLVEPKKEIGPYGYRAIIVDSEGNGVALYSSKA